MKNEKTCCQNAGQIRKETTQNTGLTTTVAVTHQCVLDTSLLSQVVFNNIPTFCHQNDDNKIRTRMWQLSNVTEQQVASWRRQSHGSVKPNYTRMNVTRRREEINTYNVQSSKPKLVDQMHLQRTDILPSRERLVLCKKKLLTHLMLPRKNDTTTA